ncbi:hypothetical protein CDD82_4085 [Ophiocordyceps australis]|uniref:RanBD1 domain-containing protein n=1 Tax=Ophiocordyceps australis TaxID=1399860 RepID=A0A2C5ZUE7_9HYPO|nr:hypothetical protein CDD82_4085 [Ophiocordyceps australis]
MVTFSLPGEDSVAGTPPTTPKPRPPLPFSRRGVAASPLVGGSASRHGASSGLSSSRSTFNTRGEVPPANLKTGPISTARSMFRSSNLGHGAGASPSTPAALKRVFAPGATPEPGRSFRQSGMAPATPRASAARVADKELFPMRIASPPSELTGEALTDQVPKDWNAKGSIYADQFLAHLCPPDLDDEQRRQFFCILDLRRLKYAANEIFTRKDWKLNVLNFAKEFEKSRSIILLRYGLYEFRNVKPSKEVLKRWRRDHGLPDPEDEDVEPSPSKTTPSKKRKAAAADDDDDDGHSKTAAAAIDSHRLGKRRATVAGTQDDEHGQEVARPVFTPASTRPKSFTSAEVEQPRSKPPQAPSSPAKSLFEKIANKSASTAKVSDNAASAPPPPQPFLAHKPATSSSLARSVFTNPSSAQASPAPSNPFGYLSDASSAKNSGVDADADSESETGTSDKNEGQDAVESNVAPNNTTSVLGSDTGNKGKDSASGPMSGFDSAPATKTAIFGSAFGNSGQQTPSMFGVAQPETATKPSPFGSAAASSFGRSLFDRVSKDSDGQLVREEAKTDAAASENAPGPADQTWNPTTTPMKFAPTAPPAQKPSMFSNASSAPPPSFLFNSQKTTETPSSPFASNSSFTPANEPTVSFGAPGTTKDKDGSESDKENESRPTKKVTFEPQPPPSQPFGNAWPQTSSMSATETPKPSTSLFGSMTQTAPRGENSSLFFTQKNPQDGPASSLFASSFGKAKEPEEASKQLASGVGEASKATAAPAFGGQSKGFSFGNNSSSSPFGANTNAPFAGSSAAPSGFGATKPSTTPFGSFSSTTSTQTSSVFGASSSLAKPGEGNTGGSVANNAGFGFQSTTSSGDSADAKKRTFESPFMSSQQPDGQHAGKIVRLNPMESNAMGSSSMGQDNQMSSSLIVAQDGKKADEKATELQSGAVNSANHPGSSGVFGSGAAANPAPGGFVFNFNPQGTSGSGITNPFGGVSNPFASQSSFTSGSSAPTGGSQAAPTTSLFGSNPAAMQPSPSFGGTSGPSTSSMFTFAGSSTDAANAPPGGGLQAPRGSSTTGTNSPLNFGEGGSSLATTPAAGTPEPSSQANGGTGADEEGGEKHEQINLTDGAEVDEEVLYHVRAKALKFEPAEDTDSGAKSKSPWSTKGIGPFRLLKHKETGAVRLLLRAEPRGHVAFNRALLPNMSYEAENKYVKIATTTEGGDGLETWMLQVKTKDIAKKLAESLEKNKGFNNK